MKSIYSILFLILVTFSYAQVTDSIPKHETFTIASKKVNETRIINVWLPSE